MRRSVIRGTGSYLPKKILTNADLEKIVDTTDEWIIQRTGIKQRHIAADDEPTSAMAVEAGKKALEFSGIDAGSIDCVLVATSTPDQTFPSVAARVQARLGIPPGTAFDMQAVCSGFVYALGVADSLIRCGGHRRILLIGAEKMSVLLDWADRTTCVLFGDGAGAVVLEADDSGTGTIDDRGILSSHLYADGRLTDILYTSGGPSTTKQSGYIVMEGREVFRHAVDFMADAVNQAVEHNHLDPAQIDWLVPHQANIRIIEATARKLSLPMEKVIVTVDRHGNTSAASIPLALDEAVRSGKIRKGDLLLMEALGAGLTWGSSLVRF
jgi:3-oxoacyl-[acyl-carrier-protein] synthase III